MFKKIFALFVLPMLLIVAGQADAAQEKYGAKSGYIKYENSNGTEEVYWDNYGEKEIRYSQVKVFGMTQTNIDLFDGKWAYNYDEKTNTAHKINQEELMERMLGDDSKHPKEFTEKMIEAYDGEKIGTDRILNRKVDVYHMKKMGDFKVWVHNGVPLKTEANIMGMSFKSEAVEYKENIKISKSRFELPKGTQIVEGSLDDMPSKEEIQQARETMQELGNNPEFQEAMKQLQDMKDDPEFQNAMKELQNFKNNPEMLEAMQKAKEAQAAQQFKTNQPQAETSVAERAGDIIKEEADSAVEETIRDTARDGFKKALGGGIKSLFNN